MEEGSGMAMTILQWLQSEREIQTIQLGLNEESVDMQEAKFKDHYALWKLNKRGVEGENIIHLLLNRYEMH